jgi:hypothetical protein
MHYPSASFGINQYNPLGQTEKKKTELKNSAQVGIAESAPEKGGKGKEPNSFLNHR